MGKLGISHVITVVAMSAIVCLAGCTAQPASESRDTGAGSDASSMGSESSPPDVQEPSPEPPPPAPATAQEWCQTLFDNTDVNGFVSANGIEPYTTSTTGSLTAGPESTVVICNGPAFQITSNEFFDEATLEAAMAKFEESGLGQLDLGEVESDLGGEDGEFLYIPGSDTTSGGATVTARSGLRLIAIALFGGRPAPPEDVVRAQLRPMVATALTLPMPPG